jgi:hypothetical protein
MRAMRSLYFFILFFVSPVLASEKLGTLSLDEFLIKPYFKISEGQEGEFGIGDSNLSWLWIKDNNVSANLRLGSLELKNLPVYFSDTKESELGLIEAYGTYAGAFGTLSAGLIPTGYSFEGKQDENKLIFSRSLIFKERVVPLRDLGLSFFVQNQGFYTQIDIHNGESDSSVNDGRVFLTSSWGWKDDKNINLGISAFTGTTKPVATSLVVSNQLAGFDSQKRALWRMASLYFFWKPGNWYQLTEIHFSELEQEEKITPFNGGHFDLGYNFTPFFSSFVRYDQFDPNKNINGDLKREISLAFEFSDKHKTHSLFLMGTKKIEQGIKIANDELSLIWRLTPNFNTN